MHPHTTDGLGRALVSHFKPLFIIGGVLVAIVGPAMAFHGPEFWFIMLAWWAFLALVAVVAYRLWIRNSGRPAN